MKTPSIILATLLLCGMIDAHAAPMSVEKLTTNNFGVWVENYPGAFQYAAGVRYKIGLVEQLENSTAWQYLSFGTIEGKATTSADFTLVGIERQKGEKDVASIVVTLRHKLLPLQTSTTFTAYANTGVITSTVILTNTSPLYPLRITEIPSLDACFASGAYEYSYLSCSWAHERKMHTSELEAEADTFRIASTSGRSSTDYSPWIYLHNKDRGVHYIAQLAWSGNWFLNLASDPLKHPHLQMGEYFDNNLLTLLPNQTLELPQVAITGATHSMDEAANNLHRYQRQHLLKVQPSNDPMLVQFNTWFPLQINVTAQNLIPYIDAAADLGVEVFTIDAGWFVKESFEREVGDWTTNRDKFPQGLGSTADYIRSKGMKFGLWFEIESLGEQSDVLKQHPEWCLQHKGQPAICEPWSRRRHLDFSNPEAFNWALEQFDKMYKECGGIDWVKLDYNVSIGAQFENVQGIETGTSLRNHITSFYAWLDKLSEHHPKLVLENCSSGALRMDLGMLQHTHTSFVSDQTSVNQSLGMAWSSTLEYTPRMINHWTVGMDNHNPIIDQSLPRAYWNHMFRVPMNGQFGVSSRILEWSPELRACAKENIALYKRIRPIIADADCYHLTPQPDYDNPQAWTVMAYIANKANEAVVLASRSQGGEAFFDLRLDHLSPNTTYKVSVDGQAQGSYTGARMAKEGIRIKLADEYRTAVVELRANQ